MSDRIRIEGMRFHGFHGVYAEERERGQTFVVDLDLLVDLHDAGESDALDDTVDYGAVSLLVRGIVEGEPVKLLETLATRIARAVLEATPALRVQVRVAKPDAPMPVPFSTVAVELERGREW
jgi:dihydroneopterin aldolase